MASSSPKVTCFQCENSNSQCFRNGWRFRNGEFAKLCDRCGSLYEEGKFCETFHSKDEGWRDCESCGKLLHCGCIASFSTFMLMDFGGVICMECWKINFKMGWKQDLSTETKTENKEPQNSPQVTSPESEQLVQDYSIEPLFEKLLSASDADHNLGRLILPKKGAEAYFPKIVTPRGCSVTILDTEGEEWEFQFRYWISGCYRTYFLEGMKEFMELNQWQPGDFATFHRIEPGEKLVIGLRKRNCAK